MVQLPLLLLIIYLFYRRKVKKLANKIDIISKELETRKADLE